MPRKPENRIQRQYRVDAETPAKLAKIAIDYGFIYNGKGAVGEMLDELANGRYILYEVKAKQK